MVRLIVESTIECTFANGENICTNILNMRSRTLDLIAFQPVSHDSRRTKSIPLAAQRNSYLHKLRKLLLLFAVVTFNQNDWIGSDSKDH